MEGLRMFSREVDWLAKPFMKKFRKALLSLWDGEIPEERSMTENMHQYFIYSGSKLSLEVAIGASMMPILYNIIYDGVPITRMFVHKNNMHTCIQALKGKILNMKSQGS